MDDSPSTGTQARTWPSLSSSLCSILPVDDTIAPIYGQSGLWEHTIGSGATTFAKTHHTGPSMSSYNTPRNESRRLLDEFEHLLILDETSTAPFGGPTSMGMSDKNDMYSMVAESPPFNDLVGCSGLHGISLQATMGPTGFLTSAQTVTAAEVDKSPSSRSCTSNRPPSLFPVKVSDSYDADINLERHAQPTTDKSQPQPSPSTGNPRARQKALLHKTQHGNAELWRTRIRATTKMLSQKNAGPIQALHKCDHIGCYKMFLRNEHLKRHKQV
ncbi:hypothetical protein Purlil1_13252 [Purpureocillium lilacinum]|uniref:C2H2-type domain-containing protein n=1 Tax=Purpureocillium lilacinum TaxID=33203 RepID=A0ABR0BEY3_PURLI|nr:hypothetical protein Purlil1_13252 [Purpureocillium lilacinum]